MDIAFEYTWDLSEPVIGEIEEKTIKVEFPIDQTNADPTLTIFYDPQPINTNDDVEYPDR